MDSDNVTSRQDLATTAHEFEPALRQRYADVTTLWRGGLGAAMASNQAAICGVQEITATLLAFLQSRAKDGVAAGQQFAACRSPEAVLEVQLEYAKAMLQAYTDEAGRLQALTGKMLADVLVPVQRSLAARGSASRPTPCAEPLAA